jgi:hypothetical protein
MLQSHEIILVLSNPRCAGHQILQDFLCRPIPPLDSQQITIKSSSNRFRMITDLFAAYYE